MTFLRNILLFALLLSLIVSLHELGHLIAAKIFNVYCKEYSIGMGPKIFSKKGKETEYCIRAFPLGGFVAMAGDSDNSLETSVDTSDLPPERTLTGIAKWKRVIIMLSGIMMNMLLAIVIYSLIILGNGTYATSSKPVIESVMEDSPALAAGFKQGDLIQKAEFENGLTIEPSSYLELVTFLSTYDGEGEWKITVLRDNEKITFEFEPEYVEEEDRYYMGVVFSNSAYEEVEVNILNCWKFGFEYALTIIKLTWSSFLTLFQGKNLNSVSGPVGIYSTVSEAADLGFYYYVQLIAMISINIGIVNALPLPIFDGGRVVLLIVEMIIGKPLSEKATNAVMTASLAVIVLLVLLATYNDVGRLIGG